MNEPVYQSGEDLFKQLFVEPPKPDPKLHKVYAYAVSQVCDAMVKDHVSSDLCMQVISDVLDEIQIVKQIGKKYQDFVIQDELIQVITQTFTEALEEDERLALEREE